MIQNMYTCAYTQYWKSQERWRLVQYCAAQLYALQIVQWSKPGSWCFCYTYYVMLPLSWKSGITSDLRPSLQYNDAIMSAMASQIASLTIVYSSVYSGFDQRNHQSSASLAFVWEIHRWPHKWPVTRKMFPFHDAIMSPCTEEIYWSPGTRDVCLGLSKD